MKKTTFLLFAFTFAINILFGQDLLSPTVKFGSEVKYKNFTTFNKIGKIDNHTFFYTHRIKSNNPQNSFILYKVDENGKTSQQKVIVYSTDKELITFNWVEIIENQIVICYYRLQNNGSIANVFYKTIEPENLNISEEKKVYQINLLNKNCYAVEIKPSFSSDKSLLLWNYSLLCYENGSKTNKPGYFVTDSKFEVISEKASDAMPNGISDPRKIFKITNDGSVFYLYRIIDANVDKVTEEVRIFDIVINTYPIKMANLYRQVYHYELACFPLEGNSKIITIGSEKRFIHSMDFYPISMDSVLVYGVMFKKGVHGISDVYSKWIANTGSQKINIDNYIEVDESLFINGFSSKEKFAYDNSVKAKRTYDCYDYYEMKLIPMGNNNFICLASQTFELRFNFEPVNLKNDLYAIKIGNKGEALAVNKISKRQLMATNSQTFPNPSVDDYATTVIDNKLYVFSNNLLKSEDNGTKFKPSCYFINSLDEDLSLQTKKYPYLKEQKFRALQFENIEWYSPTKGIIPSSNSFLLTSFQTFEF